MASNWKASKSKFGLSLPSALRMRSPQYYPNGRAGHTTVVVKDNLYLWGGYQEQIPSIHDSKEKRKMTSVIDIFHLYSGQWSERQTEGQPPLGILGYACFPINEHIYFFGGDCGHDNCYHNNVTALDITTFNWTGIKATSLGEDAIAPTRKAACGMVHIIFNKEDALFVFGGYGTCPASRDQSHSQYAIDSTNGLFRNNEQHIFIITSGEWINPDTTGEIPPPMNTLTMTKISSNRAVVFGGRIGNETTSDIYISTITGTIVDWMKLSDPLTLIEWPVGRRSHSSCCFATGEQSSSYLLVLGGEDEDNDHVNDCWLLRIKDWTWKQVMLPDESIALRSFHSVSLFYIGPRCMWVVITGGMVKDFITGPASAMIVEIAHNDKGEWIAELILKGDGSLSHYKEKLMEQLMKGRTDFASNVLTMETVSLMKQASSIGTQTEESSFISSDANSDENSDQCIHFNMHDTTNHCTNEHNDTAAVIIQLSDKPQTELEQQTLAETSIG